jgi:uncharacterized protein YndB with AHSA1/START domain
MTMPGTQTEAPVRKSVTVNADVDRAFRVFTEQIDSWWPRSHHIGSGTLERAVLEPHVNGRWYGRTTDGVETPWGTVLEWDPPHRFVVSWQITPDWKCEPDVSQSSEVEVRFSDAGSGRTRVDLEHRNFHRHGAGGANVRQAVDSEGGWSALLQLFADRVTQG